MSLDDDDDCAEPATEVERLIRRFRKDRARLSPEVREVVERADAAFQAMQAKAGKLAPVNPRDNFAIGLDDNFNPFPESVGRHGKDRNKSDEQP